MKALSSWKVQDLQLFEEDLVFWVAEANNVATPSQHLAKLYNSIFEVQTIDRHVDQKCILMICIDSNVVWSSNLDNTPSLLRSCSVNYSSSLKIDYVILRILKQIQTKKSSFTIMGCYFRSQKTTPNLVEGSNTPLPLFSISKSFVCVTLFYCATARLSKIV